MYVPEIPGMFPKDLVRPRLTWYVSERPGTFQKDLAGMFP